MRSHRRNGISQLFYKNLTNTALVHYKIDIVKKLRVLHVYLGCIFAPMLMFFAISGIWQTLGLGHSGLLAVLSTAHVNSQLKSGVTLSSSVLRAFSILMALGFIVSAVLGIIMAFTQGTKRREAFYCVAFGVLFPLGVIVVSFFLR